MNAANVIQSLLKQDLSQSKKGLSLQSGQIINAKVIKLFPNQTAEIQVGSERMIAKLEAPLSANERYWFQVQPGEGQVHLKVIMYQGQNSLGKMSPIEGLISQLGIANSEENINLVSFFVKEQLPVTKETLSLANEWMSSLDSQREGLEAIKQMMTRKLPLSKDVFLSMTAVIKNQPIHSLISNLQSLLEANQQSQTGNKLLEMITSIQDLENNGISEKAVRSLVAFWLTQEGKNSHAAFNLLQRSGWLPDRTENELLNKMMEFSVPKQLLPEKEAAENSSLKKGVQPDLNAVKNFSPENNGQKATIINEIKFLQNLPQEALEDIKIIFASENNGRANPKNFLTSLLADSQYTESQKQMILKEVADGLLDFHDKNSIKDASTNILKLLSAVEDEAGKPKITNQEIDLLKQVHQVLKSELSHWDEGPFVSDRLKQLIKAIGYHYEHDAVQFLQNGVGVEEQLKPDALKPLLIQYLNENPPSQAKDMAEQLLHKITGLQTLSQDVGPIQQYIVQVPLNFLDKTVDLTIQWNGRKKNDGTIDPDYCRILFYLDLNALKETIVDVKIQNRIINVTITNDLDSIKTIATPFINGLKENLTSLNYQLSSISFEKTTEKPGTSAKKAFKSIYENRKYNGVDIRI